MQIRDATAEDMAEVAKTSMSRGLKEYSASVDVVYALEHEGKVLAVGGMKLLTPTTAWTWMDYSADARPHMILVYRITRDWLAKMMETHGLLRVMAAVRADFPEAIRTAEHLKFRHESLMARFFGNATGLMYVLFNKE